jgi:pimeloyl-ACP methyl ester carboxylesterase
VPVGLSTKHRRRPPSSVVNLKEPPAREKSWLENSQAGGSVFGVPGTRDSVQKASAGRTENRPTQRRRSGAWVPGDRLSGKRLEFGLYGGSTTHPMMGHGSDMEYPKHPGEFNRKTCGSYRLNREKSLFGVWDRSIPDGNKDTWRDLVVAKAYAEAAMASDPTSGTRTPSSFRSRCGAMEDSFYMATGRQLWDASLITAPTLVLASERDFWSRREDRELLEKHLVHAPRKKVLVLQGGTHFVHLDREGHGRRELIDEVVAWVK